MKKLLIASAALLMCSPAFAWTNGTAHHHHRSGVHAGSTTGMGHGQPGGYVRPDASGQGGSGPGSDQGGTRVAPGTTR